VRAAQQLYEGAAREVRRDRAEHEIDRGGERLGRQRQRVERLIWHARVGEDLPRQVEVRQRPLEDNRRPSERRRPRRHLQRAHEPGQLLFAIATNERTLQVRAWRRIRRNEHRGG
jgi:hypothetical protein